MVLSFFSAPFLCNLSLCCRAADSGVATEKRQYRKRGELLAPLLVQEMELFDRASVINLEVGLVDDFLGRGIGLERGDDNGAYFGVCVCLRRGCGVGFSVAQGVFIRVEGDDGLVLLELFLVFIVVLCLSPAGDEEKVDNEAAAEQDDRDDDDDDDDDARRVTAAFF